MVPERITQRTQDRDPNSFIPCLSAPLNRDLSASMQFFEVPADGYLPIPETASGINVEVRCERCDRSFKNEKSLKQHKLSTRRHGQQRMWKCMQCERSYTRKGGVSHHQRRKGHQGISKIEGD